MFHSDFGNKTTRDETEATKKKKEKRKKMHVKSTL
jgi:hypothetical protein